MSFAINASDFPYREGFFFYLKQKVNKPLPFAPCPSSSTCITITTQWESQREAWSREKFFHYQSESAKIFFREREVAWVISIVPLNSRKLAGLGERDWEKASYRPVLTAPGLSLAGLTCRFCRGCCRCVLLSAHARQSSFGSLSFSWGFCPERKEMRQWSNFQLFHCIHDPFGNTETSTKSRQRMWNGSRPPIQVRLKTVACFMSKFNFWVYCGSLEWWAGWAGEGRFEWNGGLLVLSQKRQEKRLKRSSWIEALS